MVHSEYRLRLYTPVVIYLNSVHFLLWCFTKILNIIRGNFASFLKQLYTVCHFLRIQMTQSAITGFNLKRKLNNNKINAQM